MHEGSVAQNIIKILTHERYIRALQADVDKVYFCVGKMNNVTPATLKFYFDVLKKKHDFLVDTVLEIKQRPLTVYCSSCDQSYELEEPTFHCQSCGKKLTVQSGKEMYIENFTLVH